jgi:hypothetical protein
MPRNKKKTNKGVADLTSHQATTTPPAPSTPTQPHSEAVLPPATPTPGTPPAHSTPFGKKRKKDTLEERIMLGEVEDDDLLGAADVHRMMELLEDQAESQTKLLKRNRALEKELETLKREFSSYKQGEMERAIEVAKEMTANLAKKQEEREKEVRDEAVREVEEEAWETIRKLRRQLKTTQDDHLHLQAEMKRYSGKGSKNGPC